MVGQVLVDRGDTFMTTREIFLLGWLAGTASAAAVFTLLSALGGWL
jgi:hypothetical protein